MFNHRLGIGTNSPSNKLDVSGRVAIGTSYAGMQTAPTNGLAVQGQVGIGTYTPDLSAALDITSTTQGFLPPRMNSTQRNAISSPADGLVVYDTTIEELYYYNGTSAAWQAVGPGTVKQINTGSGLTGGPITTTGTISVATNGITNSLFRQSTANTLVGNPTGSTANVTDITLGSTLTFVSGALQTTAISGDVTTSANSFTTTIAANAVTTTKINNAAVTYVKLQNESATTLLGNPTGSSTSPSEITLGTTLTFSGNALQTSALSGDVTSSTNSFSTTVAAIAGTTVSGTTGSTNVVFSASPTLTGTLTAATISATGNVTGANLSGMNTGDQTITLTGDVTGSGTGSFAATLATVNSNIGTFSALTVNGKGLVTAATNLSLTGDVTGTASGSSLSATVTALRGHTVKNSTPTDAQILIWNNTNTDWEPVSVSGDGTITNAGVLTITKTNGVSFATSATTDTTNASNISSGSLSLSRIATIADGTLLANTSGGTSTPIATTLTQLIDHDLGTAQGDILYRNGTIWTVLAPGTSGQVLTTGGASANPSWSTVTSGVSSITGDGTVISNSASTGAVTLTLANAGAGTVLGNATSSSATPTYTSAPVLGKNATTNGTLGLANGGTSGTTITLQNLGNTSAYNFNLPIIAGSAGQVLTSQGGGSTSMTWTTPTTGTVTSIATNNGITGGTITSSGTIGLATIANHNLLANTSGSTAAPVATTLTALIDDAIASTQGDILYRNSSSWVALAPGSNGQVLTTGGASANPSWMNTSTGTVTNIATGSGLTGGPITTTGTILVATNGITNSLFRQSAANTIVGNPTGSTANVTDITLGSTLTFVSGALQTTAFTGDVTTSANSFSTTIKTNVNLSGSPTTTTQSASDNSTNIATTAFVTAAINNAIAGVNPAVAVQAATTTVLPNSPTYNNGLSGVGATLTSLTMSVLVVDGYTPVLLDRILVKNQASAFQNGVYYVSQLGVAGVTPWILTRALDYDMPSDINNTGAIPVTNGSSNIDTTWVLTSKVTTVGTDSLTYTQFTLNPTTILTNNLNSANIFVGNASNIATGVAVSGDVTITNAGVITIANNAITTSKINNSAVTYAKIQNETANTLLGNPTGSSATPSEITLGTDLTFSGGALTHINSGVTAGSYNSVTVNAQGHVTAGTTQLMTWNTITSATAAIVNNGYITNNTTLVTLTLPTTATVGDIIPVAGKGTGGWGIAQNFGQTIHFGTKNTTTGTGGSLASTKQYDCIELLCITTNTDFIVRNSVGSITVA